MQVYDYAMELEQNGVEFYEKLSRAVEHDGVRKIFLWLAEDERKHYEIFRQLKARETPEKMADSRVLEEARDLFDRVLIDERSRSDLTTNLEAYRLAMSAEQESIDLYRRALEEQDDPVVKQVLNRILVEERKHFNVLENIYDFVNKPNQSLVWGEFSNLEEY
ncbi:MAG: ferritin family protein [Pelovirga sp.]